jgi:hypothetical protein
MLRKEEPINCGVASQKGGAWATAGRTVYREEFQRDYGADLDDLLNGPEPQHEI